MIIFNRIISLFMVFATLILSMFPSIFGNRQNINEATNGQVLPETWAAVDGLGRTVPSASEVGEKDNTKFVGMFYWTWHSRFSKVLTAKNVTEILAEHPEIADDFYSPLWESESHYPNGRPFYWGKPIWGYYSSLDAYVIRKNAELLADAGVDVIFFDCTNGSEVWDESCLLLFEIFEKAKADGVNVPKVAYMFPFSECEDARTSLIHLYDSIYSKEKYKDLWFIWDGKPLILAYSDILRKRVPIENEILQFFTFRKNDPIYFTKDQPFYKKTWGWLSDYPQTKYGKSANGAIGQMCVSPAQNAADDKLVAMNAKVNVQGRSFVYDDYSYSYSYGGNEITVDKNIENSMLYGLNFQQQWDYAIECDPSFIFVVGWNEWIAGRWDELFGTINSFPDQFSAEYSRDIEPNDGVLKDHYYYQLVSNIRRFKGISDTTIIEDDAKAYYHYSNSTYLRDCDGWIGEHFYEDTMRNDFVKATVKNDNEFIYLDIYTKDDITPYTDNAWMRVLIDTDTTGISPNWEGFEYIINRNNATENAVNIEKSNGGWSFDKVGECEYIVEENKMTVIIPISTLGFTDSEKISFNFKLSDNMQTDGDILDFYKCGDVAPGGRFMFSY